MKLQSFFKKIENYWFYYKWHTIGITFFIVVVVLGVRSCVLKEEPDINILLKTTYPISVETTQKLEKAFQKYCKDYNGDKKVYVFVDALYIPDETTNTQIVLANRVRYTTDLASATSLIVGGNKETIDFLNQGSFFADISAKNAEGNNKYWLLNNSSFQKENGIVLDGDIYLALREIPDKSGDDLIRFNNNKEFFENVINNIKLN